MTIGARIAAARRAAGLSQEGLAAQVGVSRQAVAKWEADASLPGADNLQELARALNTSCDELLTGTPAAQDGRAGVLPLLKSMQAMIESQEAGRRAARRRTRWAVGGICLAVLALLGAAGAYYANTLDTLRGRVERLDSRMAGIDSVIDSQLASLRGCIEESLRQQSSIVASFDYTLALQPGRTESLLWVTATPKESAESLTARFTLLPDGAEPLTVPAEPDPSGSFSAEIPFPLTEEYDNFAVLIQFDQDGAVQSEELFRQYDYVRQYCPSVVLEDAGLIVSEENGTLTLGGQFTLSIESATAEEGNWPSECTVFLLQGDTVLWEYPVDVADFAPQPVEYGTARAQASGMSFVEELPEFSLKLARSGKIQLSAVVTTSTGMHAEDELILWRPD